MLSPQLAYSEVDANRVPNFTTTAAPDAKLGIQNKSDIGELRGDDAYQNVSKLTNNAGQTLGNVTVFAQNPNLIATPNGGSLAPGGSTDAEVKCDPNGPLNSPGETLVTFRADGRGSTVSVTRATFTVQIDIQCGKGNVDNTGLRDVFVSDVNTNQNNQDQTIEFTLTEDLAAGETVDVTLSGVEKNNRLDYTGASLSTSASGTLSDSRPRGNDYRVTFQADSPLSSGTTVSITVSGVDAGNKAETFDAEFLRSDKPDPKSTVFNSS